MPRKPRLKLEYLATKELEPSAHNARTHSKDQVQQIAASIEQFGFTNPVLVDESNGIIAGHGRILAAAELKLDKVPCIRLAHLSQTERDAYMLADNKLALNAGWDDKLLAEALVALEEAQLPETGAEWGDLAGFTMEEQREAVAALSDNDDFAKENVNEAAEASGVESSKKSGIVKDGNWFYVEFYGADDTFAALRDAIDKADGMKSVHEIDPELFKRIVEQWKV